MFITYVPSVITVQNLHKEAYMWRAQVDEDVLHSLAV